MYRRDGNWVRRGRGFGGPRGGHHYNTDRQKGEVHAEGGGKVEEAAVRDVTWLDPRKPSQDAHKPPSMHDDGNLSQCSQECSRDDSVLFQRSNNPSKQTRRTPLSQNVRSKVDPNPDTSQKDSQDVRNKPLTFSDAVKKSLGNSQVSQDVRNKPINEDIQKVSSQDIRNKPNSGSDTNRKSPRHFATKKSNRHSATDAQAPPKSSPHTRKSFRFSSKGGSDRKPGRNSGDNGRKRQKPKSATPKKLDFHEDSTEDRADSRNARSDTDRSCISTLSPVPSLLSIDLSHLDMAKKGKKCMNGSMKPKEGARTASLKERDSVSSISSQQGSGSTYWPGGKVSTSNKERTERPVSQSKVCSVPSEPSDAPCISNDCISGATRDFRENVSSKEMGRNADGGTARINNQEPSKENERKLPSQSEQTANSTMRRRSSDDWAGGAARIFARSLNVGKSGKKSPPLESNSEGKVRKLERKSPSGNTVTSLPSVKVRAEKSAELLSECSVVETYSEQKSLESKYAKPAVNECDIEYPQTTVAPRWPRYKSQDTEHGIAREIKNTETAAEDKDIAKPRPNTSSKAQKTKEQDDKFENVLISFQQAWSFDGKDDCNTGPKTPSGKELDLCKDLVKLEVSKCKGQLSNTSEERQFYTSHVTSGIKRREVTPKQHTVQKVTNQSPDIIQNCNIEKGKQNADFGRRESPSPDVVQSTITPKTQYTGTDIHKKTFIGPKTTGLDSCAQQIPSKMEGWNRISADTSYTRPLGSQERGRPCSWARWSNRKTDAKVELDRPHDEHQRDKAKSKQQDENSSYSAHVTSEGKESSRGQKPVCTKSNQGRGRKGGASHHNKSFNRGDEVAKEIINRNNRNGETNRSKKPPSGQGKAEKMSSPLHHITDLPPRFHRLSCHQTSSPHSENFQRKETRNNDSEEVWTGIENEQDVEVKVKLTSTAPKYNVTDEMFAGLNISDWDRSWNDTEALIHEEIQSTMNKSPTTDKQCACWDGLHTNIQNHDLNASDLNRSLLLSKEVKQHNDTSEYDSLTRGTHSCDSSVILGNESTVHNDLYMKPNSLDFVYAELKPEHLKSEIDKQAEIPTSGWNSAAGQQDTQPNLQSNETISNSLNEPMKMDPQTMTYAHAPGTHYRGCYPHLPGTNLHTYRHSHRLPANTQQHSYRNEQRRMPCPADERSTPWPQEEVRMNTSWPPEIKPKVPQPETSTIWTPTKHDVKSSWPVRVFNPRWPSEDLEESNKWPSHNSSKDAEPVPYDLALDEEDQIADPTDVELDYGLKRSSSSTSAHALFQQKAHEVLHGKKDKHLPCYPNNYTNQHAYGMGQIKSDPNSFHGSDNVHFPPNAVNCPPSEKRSFHFGSSSRRVINENIAHTIGFINKETCSSVGYSQQGYPGPLPSVPGMHMGHVTSDSEIHSGPVSCYSSTLQSRLLNPRKFSSCSDLSTRPSVGTRPQVFGPLTEQRPSPLHTPPHTSSQSVTIRPSPEPCPPGQSKSTHGNSSNNETSLYNFPSSVCPATKGSSSSQTVNTGSNCHYTTAGGCYVDSITGENFPLHPLARTDNIQNLTPFNMTFSNRSSSKPTLSGFNKENTQKNITNFSEPTPAFRVLQYTSNIPAANFDEYRTVGSTMMNLAEEKVDNTASTPSTQNTGGKLHTEIPQDPLSSLMVFPSKRASVQRGSLLPYQKGQPFTNTSVTNNNDTQKKVILNNPRWSPPDLSSPKRRRTSQGLVSISEYHEYSSDGASSSSSSSRYDVLNSETATRTQGELETTEHQQAASHLGRNMMQSLPTTRRCLSPSVQQCTSAEHTAEVAGLGRSPEVDNINDIPTTHSGSPSETPNERSPKKTKYVIPARRRSAPDFLPNWMTRNKSADNEVDFMPSWMMTSKQKEVPNNDSQLSEATSESQSAPSVCDSPNINDFEGPLGTSSPASHLDTQSELENDQHILSYNNEERSAPIQGRCTPNMTQNADIKTQGTATESGMPDMFADTEEDLKAGESPKSNTMIAPQFTEEELHQLLQNQSQDDSIPSPILTPCSPSQEMPSKRPEPKQAGSNMKKKPRRNQMMYMNSMGSVLAKCKQDSKCDFSLAGWGRSRMLSEYAQSVGLSARAKKPRDSSPSTLPDGNAKLTWQGTHNEHLKSACSADNKCSSSMFATPSPSTYYSFKYTSPSESPSENTPPGRSQSALDSVTWDWKARFRQSYFRWNTPFIDTHCHLDFLFTRSGFSGTYKSYREQNTDTFPPNYQACVAIFCNPRSWRNNHGLQFHKVLAEEGVYGAIGCHPKSAVDFKSEQEYILKEMLQHPKIKALGEIGLDYSASFGESKAIQIEVLRRQIEIAKSMQLPVVIHCRDAEEDCIEQLTKHMPKNYKIHRHCFTGTWDEADHWLHTFPNSMIGLTPLVTHRRCYGPRAVAQNIPLNRLLLETDSPYFIPQKIPKNAMEFSHPGMAITVAAEVAALRGIDVEEVLAQCLINSRNFYNIP